LSVRSGTGECALPHRDRILLQFQVARNSGRDQQFQQNGAVAKVSRDDEERFGDGGMLVRQRVEAVADTAEVLSFVQNFGYRHGIPDFAMHRRKRATRTRYRVRRIPRARPGEEGGRQPALFKTTEPDGILK